jgi:hypothetical protein
MAWLTYISKKHIVVTNCLIPRGSSAVTPPASATTVLSVQGAVSTSHVIDTGRSMYVTFDCGLDAAVAAPLDDVVVVSDDAADDVGR